MDVSLKNMWDSFFFQTPRPALRPLLMKMTLMRTANTAVKDKYISWSICHTETSCRLSESICFHNRPLHRIHGHILFLFQVQRRLQRHNFFLRDSFPQRCIFRGKKIMPSHCLFLTNLNIKMVHFLAEWRKRDLFAWYAVFECEVKDIIIIMLLHLWPKTGHFCNSWGLEDIVNTRTGL